jgi:HK97 family phage major capsid protein
MKKLRELRDKLAALVTEERAQLERLKTSERGMEGTEKEQYEKRAKDIGDLEAQIAPLEAVEQAEARSTEREERLSKLTSQPERTAGGAGSDGADMRAARKFLKGGLRNLTEGELRALTAGTDTEGGYLRMPQEMASELIKAVDNEVFIRGLANVQMIGGAECLGAVSLDTDVDDAAWTSELAAGAEDTALRLGKRELRPHPLAKRIKLSRKLVRSTTRDVVALVNERFGYKFGVTEEKAYMTGSGAQQPLGVFTASNDGIPTTRDVSTDNSQTAISADNLIEVKHSIKAQYWRDPSFRWVFHRDALKRIRKLKTGDGQYLWQPGMNADLPPAILEVPYVASEYAPNTFTQGLYVGILGAFRFYWIAEALNLEVQVLNELYAESNQIGYIARREIDGMPVLSEAFARVKLA